MRRKLPVRITITNNTLEPIATTIAGASFAIGVGNASLTVDVGESVPSNIVELATRGFIRYSIE